MTEHNDQHSPTQQDSEFQETVEDLQGDELRIATLKALMISPLEDERILPYLEEFLTDTSPCVVAIPYRFGEIRWLAAHALAQEREALGIGEPVILRDVVRPLDLEELAVLEKEAQIQARGGIDGILQTFAQLQTQGKLPRYDLTLNQE
jgi:hypothetical protein